MSTPTHPPVVDALGHAFSPCESPRIACLVPSITETLFSMGLGAHVVARTGFCIHPAEHVRNVPKVGGTKDVNIAKLLATEPTHVIVNIDENERPTVEKIAKSVPQVMVTHPLVPDDNHALFRLLGQVFMRLQQAQTLSDALAHALAETRRVGASMPAEMVLYLIWKQPWMTVARETYVSAMLDTVAWKTLPVQSERRYPELPVDDPAWHQAQRIFMSTEPYSFDETHVDAFAIDHPTRVKPTLIDGEYLSWYGVRAIEGLKYLRALRKS